MLHEIGGSQLSYWGSPFGVEIVSSVWCINKSPVTDAITVMNQLKSLPTHRVCTRGSRTACLHACCVCATWHVVCARSCACRQSLGSHSSSSDSPLQPTWQSDVSASLGTPAATAAANAPPPAQLPPPTTPGVGASPATQHAVSQRTHVRSLDLDGTFSTLPLLPRSQPALAAASALHAERTEGAPAQFAAAQSFCRPCTRDRCLPPGRTRGCLVDAAATTGQAALAALALGAVAVAPRCAAGAALARDWAQIPHTCAYARCARARTRTCGTEMRPTCAAQANGVLRGVERKWTYPN